MARASTQFTMTSTRQKAHFPPISGTVPVNLSVANTRQRESMCASHGLLNAPGDNNCFLNSAVQIFWHLDVFRRSFRRLNDHVCLDHACIFCGIKMLFRQFQESVDSALAPDMLRRALATTFADQQRFQLGCMDDAAECFENILLRIHYHVQGTSEIANCLDPRCLPHRKFSMDLLETLSCADCHFSTEATAFSQMVHYVTVEGLLQKTAEMKQRGVKSLTGLLGKLIRKANEGGEQRVCRRCGSANAHVKRTLTNRPDIITIGLAWPSEKPNVQTVSDTLQAIDTNICLCHLYHSARETEWASSAVHHLVGMICFYGRHYVSFFYHSRYQKWMHFDDASVKVIGADFSQVLAKCIKGHMQPLLLFYANPEFETTVGDDERYLTASSSDTSSCLSGNGSSSIDLCLALEEKRAAPVKQAPPRPPLRTVSRVTLPYQTDGTVSSSSGDQITRSSVTAKSTTAAAPRLQLPGGATGFYCARQNSRASVSSSGMTSIESFDLSSLDHCRSPYTTLPSRCRNSIDSSSARDETDSGCPSGGDHASTSSASSSSVEVPVVKNKKLYPSPAQTSFTPMDRTHSIQMLLRADDLISSGGKKEQEQDYSAAIKLFEQAAELLEACGEPLKLWPQFAKALAEKQTDCYARLHVLHDRITAHRSASTTSGSSGPGVCRLPEPMKALPRRTHAAAAVDGDVVGVAGAKKCGPVKPIDQHRMADQPRQMTSPKSVKPAAATMPELPPKPQDDSLKRTMHKSRRKATAKNPTATTNQAGSLGSRETNRSMPDLSLSGEEKSGLSHSTTLATFQSPTNYATMRVRSAARETLLNELSHRLQKRAEARTNGDRAESEEDEGEDNQGEEEEFPPPPPELLMPLSGEGDLSVDVEASSKQPCTLCGHRRVAQGPYCPACQVYLSRFSRQL
ncbi:Inactive ubiquitin carboxyl-terminal hydrolase 54 [Hypsibius exemplaris]|uniref:Inactive ubiquitin carboxyl-terminal hydrolase 54 n=1 Tax=Hypsibius exemplaris TaxID=2072580 RepID=A0A9X6NF14_HYPEX|nr:Inactive ubiquitin carboxyl-terminal hydrolase 54 [Hypsibius exemplaris]